MEEKTKSGTWTQVKLRWVFKLYIFIRALTLAQSRSLLEKGLFEAARRCLGECGSYHFKTAIKQSTKGGISKIDYDALVNDESVMKKAGELLPPRCIDLIKWVVYTVNLWYRKSFQRWVALFHVPFTNICFYRDMCATIPFVSSPGMRQMGWLFLSCHNCWIVCRFVRDDDHPYLAYSSEISHRSLFELSSVLFYLLSRMSLSSVACTVQIWNLISSRTTIPYYERMRIASLI